MNVTDRLLDQAKSRLGITSDYALAKHWKLTPQRISNWRQGESGLSEDRALEICELIGADPGPVLIELQAERARKSKHFAVADALDALLRKLGPTVATCLTLFVGIPTPADASPMPSDLSALFRQHLTDNANYRKWPTLARLILIKFYTAITGKMPRRLSLAV